MLDAEPPRCRARSPAPDLDAVLEAMADLVDLKSPYLAGHSRGVANLAAEAAAAVGLSGADVATLRRAGLSTTSAGSASPTRSGTSPARSPTAEFERVRLHPYLTDRMLARVPALAASREIAARHHERLDGSGYPRGLTAAVADAAGPAAGRGRRLPRDDRAAPAPGAARPRPGRRDACAARCGPAGSTATR